MIIAFGGFTFYCESCMNSRRVVKYFCLYPCVCLDSAEYCLYCVYLDVYSPLAPPTRQFLFTEIWHYAVARAETLIASTQKLVINATVNNLYITYAFPSRQNTSDITYSTEGLAEKPVTNAAFLWFLLSRAYDEATVSEWAISPFYISSGAHLLQALHLLVSIPYI